MRPAQDYLPTHPRDLPDADPKNPVRLPARLRLFACACARMAWHLLDERARLAVETAELYVAKGATLARLREAEHETAARAADAGEVDFALAAAASACATHAYGSPRWQGEDEAWTTLGAARVAANAVRLALRGERTPTAIDAEQVFLLRKFVPEAFARELVFSG